MENYMTTEEVLKVLKIARSTLYEWIGLGKVKTYKIAGGRKNYFLQSDIVQLFQPNEVEPKTEAVHTSPKYQALAAAI